MSYISAGRRSSDQNKDEDKDIIGVDSDVIQPSSSSTSALVPTPPESAPEKEDPNAEKKENEEVG